MRILAIDLGTSAMKLMRLDETAAVLSVDRVPMTNLSVGDWIAALAANLDAHRDQKGISGIAITGQMHGLLTRESGGAWGVGIPWHDNRSAPLIPEITERLGAVEQLTGGPIAPGFLAASLAWVRQHDPERWCHITSVHLPKDALVYELTGEHVTDPSDAAGTGMYAPEAHEWAWDVIDALGVPHGWLPRLMPSGSIAGGLRPEYAACLGLPRGLPIILAGGDAPVGAFGAGITEESEALVLLSTGAQVIRPAREWSPDAAGRWYTWPAAIPEASADAPWLRAGTLLNAGNVTAWAASIFGSELDMDEPTGLLAIPHLIGTRENPAQSGGIFGVTSSTTASEIRQAFMEGVAFSIRARLEQMTGDGTPPSRIRMGGGLAHRQDIRQLFADVLGTPVEAVAQPELSVYGAGLLTLSNLTGDLPDDVADENGIVEPRAAFRRRYDDLFTIWRELDETLTPLSVRLATLKEPLA